MKNAIIVTLAGTILNVIAMFGVVYKYEHKIIQIEKQHNFNETFLKQTILQYRTMLHKQFDEELQK